MSKTVSCPQCSKYTTNTVDSRQSRVMDKEVIRRRHICSSCKYRWSTYEIDAETVKYFLEASKAVEDLSTALSSGRIKVKKEK